MADFQKLQAVIDVLQQQYHIPSADIIVMQDHRQLYRYMNGVCDKEGQKPVSAQTQYYMYSCTKPITVVTALTLLERGKIRLDDPVAKYLPEYGQMYLLRDGKKIYVEKKMTLRHLFTMSAGLSYDLRLPSVQELLAADPMADTRSMARAFAQQPLQFFPGERFLYSVCHDVLGAVIEVASGMSFGDYMKQAVLDVAGMTHTFFAQKNHIPDALCAQYLWWKQYGFEYSMENQYVLSERYQSGGAGLVSTTEDYALFCDMLACGGVCQNGNRVLHPETIALLQTPQCSEGMEKTFNCASGPGYTYGLGVRVRCDGMGHDGEIGWDGAAGALVFADPAMHLSIAYTQHVLHWVDLAGYIHRPMRDAVYAALSCDR